jgi:hypothetical protein
MKLFKFLFFALLPALVAAARPVHGRPGETGSVLADSLAFPGEVYVLTSDQLAGRVINTVEDILDLLPGVTYWRRGPSGSPLGLSVDGRNWKGVTLLVNGHPFTDPWGGLPLARFAPLSRLKQVEVVYSGSFALAPHGSPGCVVNLVMEEGGREGPMAEADFSNSRGQNRRSRRIWFSTPRSYADLSFAYDEYLQDASVSALCGGSCLTGQYDSRSLTAELRFTPDSQGELLVRMQRFEDTFRGSVNSPRVPNLGIPGEGIRYGGFDSRLRYRRAGPGGGELSVSAGQRMVEMKRDSISTSGLVLDGGVRWEFEAAGVKAVSFADARRSLFENRISGEYFDPCIDEARGGIAAAWGKAGGLRWRCGALAGIHSEAGSWAGGEAGLCRGREDGFHQRVMLARRLRTPSAEELTQPDLSILADGEYLRSAGNGSLEPELSDEVSLGAGFAGSVSIDLFARRETRMIVLRGASPAVWTGDGEDEVLGARIAAAQRRAILGIDCGYSFSAEYNGSRGDYAAGIPEYRLSGGVDLKRSSFKNTETATLGICGVHAGESRWGDASLEGYSVLNASLAVTVMSAVVHLEWRNILDERYETFPGYLMDRRHVRFGFIWKLFD